MKFKKNAQLKKNKTNNLLESRIGSVLPQVLISLLVWQYCINPLKIKLILIQSKNTLYRISKEYKFENPGLIQYQVVIFTPIKNIIIVLKLLIRTSYLKINYCLY